MAGSSKRLEARFLGYNPDDEDCLVRCLSCHKEVVPQPDKDADDEDTVGNSGQQRKFNPGPSAPKIYRSNVPFNAEMSILHGTKFDLGCVCVYLWLAHTCDQDVETNNEMDSPLPSLDAGKQRDYTGRRGSATPTLNGTPAKSEARVGSAVRRTDQAFPRGTPIR